MTVASRTFAGSPVRDASATWAAIVELLAQRAPISTRTELMTVAGIAASIIADRVVAAAPIVVTCDGPRTRIYCTYDDDAIEGDTNEGPLGFDALQGNWKISLPCDVDELAWISNALAKHSKRIVARDRNDDVVAKESASAFDLSINVKDFLAS